MSILIKKLKEGKGFVAEYTDGFVETPETKELIEPLLKDLEIARKSCCCGQRCCCNFGGCCLLRIMFFEVLFFIGFLIASVVIATIPGLQACSYCYDIFQYQGEECQTTSSVTLPIGHILFTRENMANTFLQFSQFPTFSACYDSITGSYSKGVYVGLPIIFGCLSGLSILLLMMKPCIIIHCFKRQSSRSFLDVFEKHFPNFKKANLLLSWAEKGKIKR